MWNVVFPAGRLRKVAQEGGTQSQEEAKGLARRGRIFKRLGRHLPREGLNRKQL